MTTSVGIDLGGTNLRTAVVDDAGAILVEDRRPAPMGWEPLRAEMVAAVGAVRATHPDVTAVGVGAAGMVGRDGVVRYSPNVHAFSDTPVRADLEAALGLPVIVDNDANVAAYAEVRVGAARGCDHALVITLGTGIGGGHVLDGKVQRGVNGFAGEIGHMVVNPDGPRCTCGRKGCWEVYASGRGLKMLAAGEPGESVIERARRGDADAVTVLEAFARWVALGLSNLTNISDPDVIVIGGGVSENADVMMPIVRRWFVELLYSPEQRTHPDLRIAQLGEHAGAIGAALLAHHAS